MTAKSRFDGNTCKANCGGERLVEIAKTLGSIDGDRCGSFIRNGMRPWRCGKTIDQPTSSSKLGRTFRACRPS